MTAILICANRHNFILLVSLSIIHALYVEREKNHITRSKLDVEKQKKIQKVLCTNTLLNYKDFERKMAIRNNASSVINCMIIFSKRVNY